MKDEENRRQDMYQRVLEFDATHKNAFTQASKGTQLFNALRTEVAGVKSHAAKQVSGRAGARQGTEMRENARQALYQRLRAINLTAHSMAFEIPGLDDKFRMPRGSGDQALLSAARASAQDALPYKAQFIEYEMPATFLEDLASEIAAFEATVSTQQQSKQASVSSTFSLADSTGKCMNIVRQLDAIVRNRFTDDPATLAEWTSATHIERAPRHKKKETQQQTPAPQKSATEG
ncbi:MAG: hypothetical protein WCB68_15335 [Pyrinomonadaceae bacterium]